MDVSINVLVNENWLYRMSDAMAKHAKLQSLLNRRRKVEGTEPSPSTANQDEKNLINNDSEIVQTSEGMSVDHKRIKAKEAILWDIKRAKERAEKYGPQGWLRPKSLNTNKQFLHRTLAATVPKEKRKKAVHQQ